MMSPREGSQHRHRRLAGWAGLAILGLLPNTGCQVEYAGMTLPSGKYMHDDVQYFQRGPEFPWANTQAATMRARQGVLADVSGETPYTPLGALAPVQQEGGRITDVNVQPMPPGPLGPGDVGMPPGAIPPRPGALAPPGGGNP
ncbi:MAG: hypothetical protein U0800_09770 [Isosphaeraceae bacterium]